LIGQIDVDDVSAWEESTAPWELLARPLGPAGRFRNHKDYLITPSVILYRETFDAGVRVHGLTPAHMLTLSVPLRTGSRTAYWKTPPVANGLPIAMPGGLDVALDTGHDHLILLVSLDLLKRHLPGDALSQLLGAAARRTLAGTPAQLERFGQWQLGVLAEALQRPEAFRHAAVVHAFEQDLLRWLAAIATSANANRRSTRLPLRRLGVDKALDYIRTGDPAKVKVADLCRIAGVSERSLEYGFREAVGLTPLRYIRHQRLHAARRALLAADAGEGSVTGIAHRLGFLELGRFATHYRRLFDELPSQTLARQPTCQSGTPLLFK
jgi:AraC family ethanolamine operon transcriptional activator